MSVLNVGFVPLLDAAPIIIAAEMGFAAEEGLALNLKPAASWSLVRDMLAFGAVDAAHMLAPVPVASALALGGGANVSLSAGAVLSMNGTVIGVSEPTAMRMRDTGFGFDFADPVRAREALLAVAPKPLRLGVPFPFSMHYELVTYWLGAAGQDAVEIRTVPPSLMADAIANDEIDAFCVGEPWGSLVVEQTAGTLILPGTSIWSQAPEKVLAMRTDWGSENAGTRNALIRASVKAARWLGNPDSATIAAEILSASEFLDLPAEVLDRGLSGQLTISSRGENRRVGAFVSFFEGAANFPWRSQAEWIGAQLAARAGLDQTEARTAAASVFRSDWYRDAMEGTGLDVPGASSKIEGANAEAIPVASAFGRLSLMPNQFYDCRVFDPDQT